MVCFNLIRHGQTEADIPLSTEGQRQVALWCSVLDRVPLDLILSSPMARARATAEILGEYLGLRVVTAAGLREQAFGQWQGRRIEEIRQAFPGSVENQESLGWHS